MKSKFEKAQKQIGIALDYVNEIDEGVGEYEGEIKEAIETLLVHLHRAYFVASRLHLYLDKQQGEK